MGTPHLLKETAVTLPDRPGIYFFKNAAGETVYIGKARSLRDRVKSYFQPTDDPKIHNILAETDRIDFLLTGSEREAVFLENNFVQHVQPKFNLRLKDDKSFPYLRVTVQNPFPAVFLVRKAADDGARYFGPFSPAREARKTIQILAKGFRLRTCEDTVFRGRKRPCLEFEMGNCSAPCVGRIDGEPYRASVRDAVLFLEGRTGELAAVLRERMTAASAAERYEDAGRFRDLLRTIEQIRTRPKAISVRNEDLDIVGLAVSGGRRAVQVFQMRGGKVRESMQTILDEDPGRPPAKTVGEFLTRFYSGRPIPGKIIVPVVPSGAGGLQAAWKTCAGQAVSLTVPKKGRNRTLLDWASKNAEILLRRAPGGQSALEDLRAVLGLSILPVRIDGFDVSHTRGLETVASLVTFLNGRPWKDGYRKYIIKGTRGPDDTASLREAVTRRLTRVLREDRPKPDLVFVDGGLPQLSAAMAALAELGLSNLPVAALAKREETLYTAGRPGGLRLERTSPALKLIQHVRDEAHRFAVAFHRSRRTKRSYH
ncbi:MAG: excinuclease ABC subunit UvrC [Candidatus Aminicenantes bacterium]|nr:excinuclease ABC subunit UvrC [Candidatus Aminicenantes bacterium]